MILKFLNINYLYKNVDKFEIIKQGAVITKGELYQWFEQIVE